MDEKLNNSKKITSILLARNTPVALVVGAASFFGSHLVDRLLLKNLQVIGIDELISGNKENLREAIGNKSFHLVIDSPGNLDLGLERLDYIFITSDDEVSLKNVLELFKKFKCRLLFLSSIELYSIENITSNLRWVKDAESEIAKCAKEHNLNARVLRLGYVFGPRMNFKNMDPTGRLIYQSLTENLQKEISLDFSSRALYVEDACDLAVRCIFAGATAQKIFDGVSPTPIKVSEIKQVLLDPIWHESRDFQPSELPPWPTPNLEKTIKFLHWYPKTKLVEALRKTLQYFKDNEIELPTEEVGGRRMEEGKESGKAEGEERGEEWKVEKQRDLEAFKGEIQLKGARRRARSSKLRIAYSKIFLFLTFGFIAYALIWPLFQLGWGVLGFRFQLAEAVKNLERGEFDRSLGNVGQANDGVSQAKSIFASLEVVRQTGILKEQFELGDNLSNIAILSLDSAQNTILGIQSLYQGLKAVTGELTESPKSYFDLAKTYLAAADLDLSKAYALLRDQQFKDSVPEILRGRVDSLENRLSIYSSLVQKARTLSVLLPEVIPADVNRNYLILLQNNNELRPTGGFIGSFAKVSFEAGKLKKLEVNDVYAIDGQLGIHVEPPKEIKEDLDQKDYFLRDSNWEPDFPTAARQAEWFYSKETGERVEGVLALDISAMEDLLSIIGPTDLPDYDLKISSDNLFGESVTHSETGFFPGSQAKKSFLTALTQAVLNKLFFLPNQNWPGIVSSLGKSMEQKHMSVYLDNPKLFSYLVSQNWASVLPRGGAEDGDQVLDFLAPVEANLGANKANYYLDRSYNLETVIGKEGDITHRLRISYTNRSPSNTFPAGKYKNRMRVYLPFGTKLARVLWGESDITNDLTSYADYGRSVYSFLLELLPKEQKVLVLDYQIPKILKFVDNKAAYKLDVIKQAGILKDPFIWKISYPISYNIVSPNAQKLSPQEQTIETDLSKDRSFEAVFTK